MKIIRPSYEILTPINGIEILKAIEVAGRTCYKSEDLITEDSVIPFCNKLVHQLHHESVIEHQSITVRFINDRGVSHEEVRHRLASFSQESTRYCNYVKDKFGNEITVIDIQPVMEANIGKTFYHPITNEPVLITTEIVMKWLDIWMHAMIEAEKCYLGLVDSCCPAQLARSVLPNSLKTEIVITANLREWRTILKQRTSPAAHPQMRELMIPLLKEFQEKIPVIFDDI
jgi:thymidylate synthase (FAD)